MVAAKCLLSIFWKRTTRKAVNLILSVGSAFSLGVGVLYLWILTPDKYHFWPHYLVLSFLIFTILLIVAVITTLLDRSPVTNIHAESDLNDLPPTSKRVKILWAVLGVIMVGLYFFFNGH